MYECVFYEADLFWRVYQDGELVRIIHGYSNLSDWMDWLDNTLPEQPMFHISKGDD